MLQRVIPRIRSVLRPAQTTRLLHIQPFKAFRPPPELTQDLIAPPYDTLSSEEARVLAAGNSKSFLRVNKAEIDFAPEVSPYDEKVYQKAKSNLEDFIRNGWLIRDTSNSFYIYAQKMGTHMQYGVCAGVRVKDYKSNIIKKHELTVKKKEDDRTKLTYIQNANVGLVFLTYRQSTHIDALVQEITRANPESRAIAPDDQTEHMVWPVSDPQKVAALQAAFEPVPVAYIADGHHRSASAFRVGEMKIDEAKAAGLQVTGEEPFCHFMAVLFPAPQLQVLNYNRVVRDLNGLTADQFLAKVCEKFDVNELKQGQSLDPPNKGTFSMYLNGKWMRLAAKSGSFDAADPVKSLDVQVLYDNLLSSILAIGNPRTDERIKYVGGIRGTNELVSLVKDQGWAVAFAMHPVSVDEVMDIADAGAIMPPKATWFEPKLKSGLIVRTLDS